MQGGAKCAMSIYWVKSNENLNLVNTLDVTFLK